LISASIRAGLFSRCGAEEALQPDEVGRSRITDENSPCPSNLNQTHPTQDESASRSRLLGGADHQAAKMSRVERERHAAFSARAPRHKRFPRRVAYLARESSDAMARDCSLAFESVATRNVNRAFEGELSRGMALTHVKEIFTGCKIPRDATCEALCGLHPACIEHGKQLNVHPRVSSRLIGALLTARRSASRPTGEMRNRRNLI
jgi:hypothetical protein